MSGSIKDCVTLSNGVQMPILGFGTVLFRSQAEVQEVLWGASWTSACQKLG